MSQHKALVDVEICDFDILTPFEQTEINSYLREGLYFLGDGAQKISRAFTRNPADETEFCSEKGFDDEQGYYRMIPNDHLKYRYETIRTLGRGAYSEVVESIDHKTSQRVAVKIFRNRGPKTQSKHLLEVERLAFLNDEFKDKHIPFVRMLEHFSFRGHPCIVFDLLCSDLQRELKNRNFKGLRLFNIMKIARSLLKGLHALKCLRLVHGDVKPANVAFKENGKTSVRLIDFGNCHFETKKPARYMQSRYYRAPEVILRLRYNGAVDMWAVGCIAAELFLGTPLFTGTNEGDQLACMIECLGMPPLKLLCKSSVSQLYFTPNGDPLYCARQTTNATQKQYEGNIDGKRGLPGTKCLTTILKSSKSPLFIDFVKKCLTWNPEMRLTPSQALKHRWFTLNQLPNAQRFPAVFSNFVSESSCLYDVKQQANYSMKANRFVVPHFTSPTNRSTFVKPSFKNSLIHSQQTKSNNNI